MTEHGNWPFPKNRLPKPLPEGHAENAALDLVEAELQRLRENVATLLRALTDLYLVMLPLDLQDLYSEVYDPKEYARCMAEAKAAIDKASQKDRP